MDEPGVDPGELGRALGYIRAVNSRLGGVDALLGPLKRWARRAEAGGGGGGPLTLLDIATGSGDLPLAAARWARGAGVELRITAVDVHEKTLAEAARVTAAEPWVRLERADAFELVERYGAGSFDFVHAGLFIHHLENEVRVLTMLRIMDRLARRGVIWNDLIRSRVGRAAIGLMTVGQPWMIRHDARASVAAGFRPAEALDLARRAGWARPRCRSSVLTHRFVVTSERAAG